MSRRSDHELRHAISVIERMVLTDPDPETVISRCLKQLMGLLRTTFGYAFHCIDKDSGNLIRWNLVSCIDFASNGMRDLPNTCTIDHIPQSLTSRLLSGRCLHSNEVDSDFSTLPHFHPKITNYFCLPITDARRIYAVIFLCNAAYEFDESIEARLRPFVATAGCLLRSAEKKNKFQQTLIPVNSDEQHPEFIMGLLDSMFNGVILIDGDDNIKFCNHAAGTILGLPRSQLIGMTLNQFLPKGAPQIIHRLSLAGADENRDTEHFDKKTVWRGIPLIKNSGEKILIDITGFEFGSDNLTFRGIVIDDISEHLSAGAAYHTTLQRFHVLTALAPVGILQLDREWECVYANDTWCEFCQMTPDEAAGTGWLRGLHFSEAEGVLDTLRHDLSVFGKFEMECRLQTPLGHITWVKANACGLYTEAGEISGLIMTFSDITVRLDNERRLREIAERDQLTGLINRTFFNDRVEVALEGIKRFGSVAIMFIDLDEFKHINDTLGHDAGDQLLISVSRRLQNTLRKVDTIARIGGDEFTVLLTHVQNENGVTAIADKLIEALIEPFILEDKTVYVTCSIGIAFAKNDKVSLKQLLKQADAALYKAKEAGRNQYKFYTPALDEKANIHIYLRQSLKDEQRNDFRLVYQPQVEASTGQIQGFEALARWRRSDLDPIGPDIFIKMIEESGLIHEFSDWLLHEAFSTLSAWIAAYPAMSQISVSINLSAKQFRDPDLDQHIADYCSRFGLDPSNIMFEVTETALIDDPKVAAATLSKLRAMGFGIALDDFGTGYSSLRYLRDMPLHCVKIDRSFIKSIIDGEEDEKMVHAILTLAKTLNLDVIAEGVDNLPVKDWLIEHGCPQQQGFFFSQPMEREAVELLLETLPSSTSMPRFAPLLN